MDRTKEVLDILEKMGYPVRPPEPIIPEPIIPEWNISIGTPITAQSKKLKVQYDNTRKELSRQITAEIDKEILGALLKGVEVQNPSDDAMPIWNLRDEGRSNQVLTMLKEMGYDVKNS